MNVKCDKDILIGNSKQVK